MRLAKWVFFTLFAVIACAGSVRAQCPSQTNNIGFQLPSIGQTNTWGVCVNGNFAILDTLLGGTTSLQSGTTTPALAPAFTNFVTANTVSEPITNLTGGFAGQTIRIICGSGDSSTSVVAGVTISLSGPWSCPNYVSLTLTLVGNIWTETGRYGTGGGFPGGALNAIQVNAPGPSFAGAQGLKASSDGNSEFICGPTPWSDINCFGARALSAPLSTLANCNSNTTINLNANPGFIIGDGVVVYGCGAAEAMATPNPPAIIPGVSSTLTVPDAILQTSTGATSYSYKLISRDKFGGLTIPSTATSIADGLSVLGENQLTISTISISGNTMTVIMNAPESLVSGMLIHITASSTEAVRGWYTISSITNSTTFVVSNLTIYSATGINAIGGTVTYYAGNQLTWTNGGSNIWETIICASRPADSGAYHVIGLSYPVNPAVAYGSSTTFTDWGATLTSKPNLPSYISDSICTASSVTNDYLSTTITNISGTTITVANAAARTIVGQAILFDNAPAIIAAANSANNSVSGILFVPSSSAGIFYYINSFLNLSSFGNLTLRQEGILYPNETMLPPSHWIGLTGGRNSTTGIIVPTVNASGWPGIYYNDTNVVMDSLDFEASGNQALPVLIDGGGSQVQGAPQINNIIFNTGSTSDYTGIGLVVRPAPFNTHFSKLSFRSGPGNSSAYTNTSWTPAMYFARDISNASGASGLPFWNLSDIQFFARTFYDLGGSGNLSLIHNVYTQGNLLPTINIQNAFGLDGGTLKLDGIVVNDTSGEAYISLIGSGTRGINLQVAGLSGLSSGGISGIPPQITGTAPGSLHAIDNQGSNIGPGAGSQPVTALVNASTYDRLNYYSADYFDSGNFSSSRGIQRYATPVSSLSAFFVPLGVPILAIPVASAGGSIPDGTHLYCVQAVGYNGGWGESSCQSVTIIGSNQTLSFSWAPVVGAKGYIVSQDNQNCLPTANATCTGLTTLSGITTFNYTGGGLNVVSISTMNASGDGVNGFNAGGLFGLRTQLIPTTVGALPSAASSASQIYTVNDSTAVNVEGQACVGGSSNTALAFSNGTSWKCF